MTDRHISLLDRCLAEIDTALRTLAATTPAGRPSPAEGARCNDLSPADKQLGAALMRVNHAGEVAAQALYRGQAFTTREPDLRSQLLSAGREEQDHLAWCEGRIRELGGRTSLLGPLWYAGSFVIGALAGLTGKGAGLGFVVETERQVEQHLAGQLERLPLNDVPSRKIVTQIRIDEARHRAEAQLLGSEDLPGPVRAGMRLLARFMTTVAHHW